jgi:hypothetical protein
LYWYYKRGNAMKATIIVLTAALAAIGLVAVATTSVFVAAERSAATS